MQPSITGLVGTQNQEMSCSRISSLDYVIMTHRGPTLALSYSGFRAVEGFAEFSNYNRASFLVQIKTLWYLSCSVNYKIACLVPLELHILQYIVVAVSLATWWHLLYHVFIVLFPDPWPATLSFLSLNWLECRLQIISPTFPSWYLDTLSVKWWHLGLSSFHCFCSFK